MSTPPLLSCALAAQALLEADDDEVCKRLLPRLAGGELIATVAFGEPRAEPFVTDAEGTILLAHDDALYEVIEVDVTALEPMDVTRRLATVDVRDARHIGPANAERLRDTARVLLSAEQVGAATRALQLTVEYTKLRVQFGRPIGSFQAIQHRLADLHVLVESARAVSYAAAAGETHPSVAKAYCSEALSRVAAEMIQLHGGVGITWEHDAHRFFKRAHGSWHLFGQPRDHVSRLAAEYLIN